MIARFPRFQLLLLSLLFALLPGGSLAAGPVSPAAPATKPLQGGVGLQVVPIASGEIVVIAVLPKSPAAQARILPGDLITAVDGKSLRGSNFADVTRSRLWGRAGSKVKITWQRPGVAGKKNAQLVRAALKDDPAQDLEVKMLVPTPTPLPEVTRP